MAVYRYTIKVKTNDTTAPFSGVKSLDVFATDFSAALVQAEQSLTDQGYSVLTKEEYDENESADPSTLTALMCYMTSVELKVLVTASA